MIRRIALALVPYAICLAVGGLLGTVGFDWAVRKGVETIKAEAARALAPGPIGQCYFRS